MRRPKSSTQKTSLFPIGRIHPVQRRVGMEYQATTQARPIPAPTVPVPIRQSFAQQVGVHRFQFTRYFGRLRTYGFAPGNPVLHAFNQRYSLSPTQRRPTPVISGGKRSGPLSVARTPGVINKGSMGSPKRFPKALPLRVNTYKPPIYGQE